MKSISTHVLDTSRGKPVPNIPVTLEMHSGKGQWKELATAVTNAEGRISPLLPKGSILEAGRYRLTFATSSYFDSQGTKGFYPYISIVFEISEPNEHYHIPLLLSPFGFSSYRGS